MLKSTIARSKENTPIGFQASVEEHYSNGFTLPVLAKRRRSGSRSPSTSGVCITSYPERVKTAGRHLPQRLIRAPAAKLLDGDLGVEVQSVGYATYPYKIGRCHLIGGGSDIALIHILEQDIGVTVPNGFVE